MAVYLSFNEVSADGIAAEPTLVRADMIRSVSSAYHAISTPIILKPVFAFSSISAWREPHEMIVGLSEAQAAKAFMPGPADGITLVRPFNNGNDSKVYRGDGISVPVRELRYNSVSTLDHLARLKQAHHLIIPLHEALSSKGRFSYL